MPITLGRFSIVATAFALRSAVAFATDLPLAELETASDKIKFVKIAKHVSWKRNESFSASWCPAFLQGLGDKTIKFIRPALETDDSNVPELSEYNRCKDEQFWDVGAGGWAPEDSYLSPGYWSVEHKIQTDDILIIPWNLRYRSLVPDIGHRNFKLYRLPSSREGGSPIEVVYGRVDPDLDKTNTNYLRLDAPGRRIDSGYWIIETKQCYAKWRDMWVGHRSFDKPSYHGIVQYGNEYYVLKFYPGDASGWVMELELVAHRKERMTTWRPCVWSGEVR